MLASSIEKLDKMKITIPVFLPVSKYLIAWYFLLLFVVYVDFFVTIIVICYEDITARIILYEYINIMVFPLLIIDILLTFNTGFIQDGKMILVRKNIAKKYIKSIFFFVDVWSASWSFIQIMVVHVFETQFPYMALLIFLKFVKISAFDSLIVKYILRSSATLFSYRIIKNLLLLIVVCHVFGSLFFLIDVKMINAGWYQNTQYNFWTIDSFCYADILNAPFSVQYIYSFYFIIVTLAGIAYGDLTPLNPTQTIYVFGCVAFPILIYAYLFKTIYSAIQQARAKSAQEYKTRAHAKQFFTSLGINKILRQRLLNYVAYYCKNRLTSSEQFMKDLAPSLRERYKLEAWQKKMDLTIFYPIGWDELPKSISQIVKQQFVPQRYNLGKQNKLLYINEGKIIAYVKMKSRYSKIIEKNEFIGQYPFFTGILTNSINVQTQEFTICQTIAHSDFKISIQQNSAELNESYCLIRDQVVFYGKVSLIRYQCFFCAQKEHTFQHCLHLRGFITSGYIGYKSSPRNQGLKGRFKRNKIKSKKIFEQHNRSADIGIFVDNQTQVDLQLQQKNSHNIEAAMKWSLKYYPFYNIY